MSTKRSRCSGLGGFLALVLLLPGCSKTPEPDQPRATDIKEKSDGVLSKLLDTTESITVPQGTAIPVTLDQDLASNQQRSGDSFQASVSAAIIVNGKAVIPKGARIRGRVVEARESGRLHTVARLRLALNEVEVHGKSYEIHTSTISRSGSDHKKRNVELIGGGAALGTVVGAIAGGGKGALIGGAAGAGAGTAAAAATGKKDIRLPAETSLTFKLTQAVTIQVKG